MRTGMLLVLLLGMGACDKSPEASPLTPVPVVKADPRTMARIPGTPGIAPAGPVAAVLDPVEATPAVAAPAPAPTELDVNTWQRDVSTHPMTGEVRVFLAKVSDNQVHNGIFETEAQLAARCLEGEIALMVLLPSAVLDADIYGDISSRVKFGQEKPQRVTLIRADTMAAAFFPKPRKWIGLLRERPNQTFTVELPVFRTGPQFPVFSLGPDVGTALQEVLDKCPAKK